MEIEEFDQLPLIEKFRLLKEREARFQKFLKEAGLES